MYNLKLAFRNLRRNALYSWINITGLSIALCTCILMALWIQNELTFDHLHKKADQIYRINAELGEGRFWPKAAAPIAPMVLENYPEVLDACRVENYYTDYLEYSGKNFFGMKGIAVDDNFFTFFDFTLLEGNASTPFQDDLSLVISEAKATLLFGDDSPIGKVVKDFNGLSFHVVGVVKDVPDNSSIQFDYIVPRLAAQRTYRGSNQHIDEDWGWYRYQTFFLLHDHASPDTLAKKIGEQVTEMRSKEKWVAEKQIKFTYLLQPLKEVHLYKPDGSKSSDLKTLYLLAAILVFILLIACINYVNIVTARGIRRGKEIAMRKIMGANKKQLFFQLLMETLLLLLLALIVASVLIYVLTPAYNTLTGKQLVFSFANPVVLSVYAAMALSVVTLAGVYPALSLLSFSPLAAFRGHVSGNKRESILRKSLVVAQFAISVILVTSTFTVSRQVRYMRQKDLGYDKENVFTMPARSMNEHYDVVRNELLKNPQILDVTGSEMQNMLIDNSRTGVYWQGKPKDFNPQIHLTSIKGNFTDMLNIDILEGEMLHPQDSLGMLINEEAKRIMQMENPVGQPFYMYEGAKVFYTIKGVVKDFHFKQLNQPIAPLIIINCEDNVYSIYVKVRPEGAKEAIRAAEKLWKQYNPDYDFEYLFLDDAFDRFYKKEVYIERILLFFTVVALFISCIGIFGLATYTAETRTKEIGIRKTLGASTLSVVRMLSNEFTVLMAVAVAVGIPVAYHVMDRMLQDYSYRIGFSWWAALITIILVFVLVILTVSIQAIRAAKANPVKAIKTE